MSDLPSVDQVDQIAPALTRTAPQKYRDMNDHVNVRGHYDLHLEATELAFTELFGFGESYVARTGQSSFSVAHHVQFHAEILIGQQVSAHLRILARGPKSFHGVTILANRTTRQIASTLEFVEVYVDLSTRRSAPIPDEFAQSVDQVIARHRALDWTMPASEQLGVSRPRQG